MPKVMSQDTGVLWSNTLTTLNQLMLAQSTCSISNAPVRPIGWRSGKVP